MKWGSAVGCHQMPERSFFFRGYQFPICARCTGVLFSTILAVVLFFNYRISIMTSIYLSAVMLFDWSLQYFGILASTNSRRLITGFIGGFGVSTLHMYFYRLIYHAFSYLLSIIVDKF
ncbi:MAG: DUF2085 domain-containing protein [Victivallales bacterium]|nr:DUF2085 domain-containing protein [Victivallales bacterium]